MTPIKNADGQVIGYKLDESAPETPAPVYLYAPEEAKPEFKVGDRVRVTGTKEELNEYSAQHAFEKDGTIIRNHAGPGLGSFLVVELTKGGTWNIKPEHLEKLEFKVGDKVRIRADLDANELEEEYKRDGLGWDSDMEDELGAEGVVVTVLSRGWIEVDSGDDTNWAWKPEHLEKKRTR